MPLEFKKKKKKEKKKRNESGCRGDSKRNFPGSTPQPMLRQHGMRQQPLLGWGEERRAAWWINS